MIKALRHFRTITKHRHKVIYHCIKAGIPFQGLFHDLSKYNPVEFLSVAKFYTDGTSSPNERERLEYGYSKAWLHHKGRNKHHFEYWTDYDPHTHRIMPVKMPKNYVVEMFCDRVAASKIYQRTKYNENHPLEYFLRAKDTRVIHPETSDQLENLLKMLSEKGENESFKYIKNVFLKEK